MKLTCKGCGKKVFASEKGYASRMKKFSGEEDMLSNFLCRNCKKEKKE